MVPKARIVTVIYPVEGPALLLTEGPGLGNVQDFK
jgi:hypothetical protein